MFLARSTVVTYHRACLGRRFYSKDVLSPLGKHLSDSIKINGPITMARYMREVLVNPLSGYYMHGDVFGSQGDFVTSPEISQMFGELSGIWYLTEWMRLGKPAKTQIIECGPGRGTLMSDMLRALARFPHFYQTITGVHLIEASPGLREIQKQTLLGKKDTDLEKKSNIVRDDGIQVFWHDGIEFVPKIWSLVMAHEFFDAMPAHSFEKTEEGWRELLVDLDDTNESENHFRIVRSKAPTAASKAFMNEKQFETYKVGDRIELSPDSWYMMEKLARVVQEGGGAGLVVDYGQDYTQGDTLRAIRRHQIVHPMSDPGSADLSVDVDFGFLRQAVSKVTDVSTHGPITQSKFLQSLGIQARLEMLLKHATSKSNRINLAKGFQRLLDPAQMGSIYKVLAFSKENGSSESPVGFSKD